MLRHLFSTPLKPTLSFGINAVPGMFSTQERLSSDQGLASTSLAGQSN